MDIEKIMRNLSTIRVTRNFEELPHYEEVTSVDVVKINQTEEVRMTIHFLNRKRDRVLMEDEIRSIGPNRPTTGFAITLDALVSGWLAANPKAELPREVVFPLGKPYFDEKTQFVQAYNSLKQQAFADGEDPDKGSVQKRIEKDARKAVLAAAVKLAREPGASLEDITETAKWLSKQDMSGTLVKVSCKDGKWVNINKA